MNTLPYISELPSPPGTDVTRLVTNPDAYRSKMNTFHSLLDMPREEAIKAAQQLLIEGDAFGSSTSSYPFPPHFGLKETDDPDTAMVAEQIMRIASELRSGVSTLILEALPNARLKDQSSYLTHFSPLEQSMKKNVVYVKFSDKPLDDTNIRDICSEMNDGLKKISSFLYHDGGHGRDATLVYAFPGQDAQLQALKQFKPLELLYRDRHEYSSGFPDHSLSLRAKPDENGFGFPLIIRHRFDPRYAYGIRAFLNSKDYNLLRGDMSSGGSGNIKFC